MLQSSHGLIAWHLLILLQLAHILHFKNILCEDLFLKGSNMIHIGKLIPLTIC